jgi:DNA-binding transcriptional LysR family regulator
MLDLQALRVFREVARRGSFGQAAQALAYTPPAVSQRIAALEREHGVRLFERSPRGVWPTPAGRLLLGHADGLLQGAEAARADLAAAAEFRRGRIRLGVFATAAAGFVADALRAIRARTEIEVDVLEGEPYRLLPRVAMRELDLAVVFSYQGQPASITFEGGASVDESRLTLIALGQEPLLLVVGRDHPLATCRHVRPIDLRDEPFIPVSPVMPTFPDVERHLGFRPRFAAVQTADYQAILGLVAAGIGVALIPRMALETAHREDVVAPPLARRTIRRRVDVALPAGGYLPAVTKQLLDALTDAAGGLDRPPECAMRESSPGTSELDDSRT